MVSFQSVTNINKLERLRRAASRANPRCLSSSPIPLLYLSLRVTLTHFTLSFYERALCLPTSLPISGLSRLGVKPRLCGLSWRAFASTHPLRLPSTSPRKALFACPPSPPWKPFAFTGSPPFPLHALALIPLFLAKVLLLLTLALSPPHDLVLWTDGSVSFGKGGSGVLSKLP